jgi:mannose-6-phosphate isomerase-like protein (cupin superfamily)
VTSTARPTTNQSTASGAATSRRGCLAEAADVRRPTWRTRIRPGDVIYIEPNEEHSHGATADRFMAHVAIQEADEQGDVVTWLDHVTDEEYSLR